MAAGKMIRLSLFCFSLSNFAVVLSGFGLAPARPFRSRSLSAWSIPFGFHKPTSRLYSSFAADGSEYSSNRDNNDFDDDDERSMDFRARKSGMDDEEDDTPTIELQPVPLSKNAGNRFVAVVWDKQLYKDKENDVLQWHLNRVNLTEDHVMFCRKANLYNETFNVDSNVDVLWSLQILSSDLKRAIGHAMCLESTRLEYVHDLLRREPIIQMLTGGDLTNIPLYRWRHVRDYSLRIDDGRFGYPCMCLALDSDAEQQLGTGTGGLRSDLQSDVLEYLIRSERVIASGPLHLPTEFKDDPSSLPVGDLVLFNAQSRDHAVEFAENLPGAQEGLYGEMRVHFYNSLDVTGKFVSEDPLRDAPGGQMKEALEYWGYPVADDQTPWLNW